MRIEVKNGESRRLVDGFEDHPPFDLNSFLTLFE